MIIELLYNFVINELQFDYVIIELQQDYAINEFYYDYVIYRFRFFRKAFVVISNFVQNFCFICIWLVLFFVSKMDQQKSNLNKREKIVIGSE